jgi:cysteine synthase A
VAEPTGSAFAHGWRTRDRTARASQATVIEGIGRPCAEPGFLYDVVDRVVEVDDGDSIAAMRQLEAILGQRYGGSSGTNFAACLRIADEMRAAGERGSVVSLLCDRGERYAQTLYAPDWLRAHGLGDTTRAAAAI